MNGVEFVVVADSVNSIVFRKAWWTALCLLSLWGGILSLRAQDLAWPDAADPIAGMGICYHFNNLKPGDLEMLSHAGFRWGRMDFSWDHTEQKPGVYDFSTYDRSLAVMQSYHLRPLLILDYGNKLYDEGMSPHTDAGRAAYARWAVAAVTHFQGRGIIWEIWNEPNQHFWKPHPNAGDYAQLALTASRAIQQAAPGEILVGPSISGDDIAFIETSAKAGLLQYWSAISVHPYHRRAPETCSSFYAQLRALIQKYGPPGKKIDIICSETGYSTSWWGLDDEARAEWLRPLTHLNDLSNIPVAGSDEVQGKCLARLYLFNVMSGLVLTLWYDFHDDGTNPTNEEHNFGIVRHDYHGGMREVYERKPAYDAAQTYANQLAGFRFRERLWTPIANDFVLSFAKSGEECLVAWTADWASHNVTILVPNGTYEVTSFDGKKHSTIAVTEGTMTLRLDDGPQYLKRKDSLPNP